MEEAIENAALILAQAGVAEKVDAQQPAEVHDLQTFVLVRLHGRTREEAEAMGLECPGLEKVLVSCFGVDNCQVASGEGEDLV